MSAHAVPSARELLTVEAVVGVTASLAVFFALHVFRPGGGAARGAFSP